MNKFYRKVFYSFLLMIIVALSATLSVYLKQIANYNANLGDVYITNQSSSAFSVVWMSEAPTVGTVSIVNKKDCLFGNKYLCIYKEFHDDRDVEEVSPGEYELSESIGKYMAHHVTARGLESNSEYFVRIVDHENKYLFYDAGTAETVAVLEELELPSSLYGRIINGEGDPLDDVLVIIELETVDGLVSQKLSTITYEGNGWISNVSNLYDYKGERFYSDSDTVATMIFRYKNRSETVVQTLRTDIAVDDVIILESNEESQSINESNLLVFRSYAAVKCELLDITECDKTNGCINSGGLCKSVVDCSTRRSSATCNSTAGCKFDTANSKCISKSSNTDKGKPSSKSTCDNVENPDLCSGIKNVVVRKACENGSACYSADTISKFKESITEEPIKVKDSKDDSFKKEKPKKVVSGTGTATNGKKSKCIGNMLTTYDVDGRSKGTKNCKYACVVNTSGDDYCSGEIENRNDPTQPVIDLRCEGNYLVEYRDNVRHEETVCDGICQKMEGNDACVSNEVVPPTTTVPSVNIELNCRGNDLIKYTNGLITDTTKCLSKCITKQDADDYCELVPTTPTTTLTTPVIYLKCGSAYSMAQGCSVANCNSLEGGYCVVNSNGKSNCAYGLVCKSGKCEPDGVICKSKVVQVPPPTAGSADCSGDKAAAGNGANYAKRSIGGLWSSLCESNNRGNPKPVSCDSNPPVLILNGSGNFCKADSNVLCPSSFLSRLSSCQIDDLITHELEHVYQGKQQALFNSEVRESGGTCQRSISCSATLREVSAELSSGGGGGYGVNIKGEGLLCAGDQKVAEKLFTTSEGEVIRGAELYRLTSGACPTTAAEKKKWEDEICSKLEKSDKDSRVNTPGLQEIWGTDKYQQECRQGVPINVPATIGNTGFKYREGFSFVASANGNKLDIPQGYYKLDTDRYSITHNAVLYTPGQVLIVFNDRNNDGVRQSDEEALENVRINVNEVVSLETFKIEEGWNTIGFPILISTEDGVSILKATQLIRYFRANKIQLDEIVSYDEGVWKSLSLYGDVVMGDDYDLIPGKAYFVKSSNSGVINVYGPRYDTDDMKYRLVKGWNLINIPRAGDITAKSVVEDAVSELSEYEIDAVSKWEAARYQTLLSDGAQYYGYDYKVWSSKGYLVRVR